MGNSEVKQALLTGSRVYGTPNEDSDIDLVVLLEPWEIAKLSEVCNKDKEFGEIANDDGYGGVPLRFGNLNLLCVSTQVDLAVWYQGTQALKFQCEVVGPVTRDSACALFKSLRDAAKGLNQLISKLLCYP